MKVNVYVNGETKEFEICCCKPKRSLKEFLKYLLSFCWWLKSKGIHQGGINNINICSVEKEEHYE